MNGTVAKISVRDRDTIIQALAAGVVPRNGLQHFQVGRAAEVSAILSDIDRITNEGSAVRFIIGDYGAGKTFFLHLTRLIALEKKLVTIQADLAPERRLLGSAGQARALYAEAVRNMATRAKPNGGALASIMERFLTDAVQEAAATDVSVEAIIDTKLASLHDDVGGYDYTVVLKAYLRGSESGDESLKTGALRWIRGEFSTKTEARSVLPVRNIIDDANVYNSLKLLGSFVKIAGYGRAAGYLR